MNTGVEIDHNIVSGLLSSMEAGEKCFREFVDQRLQATGGDRKYFFDKIVNLEIRTSQEKAIEGPKGCEHSQGGSTSFWFVGLFHLLYPH